jgi:hypothetical protein
MSDSSQATVASRQIKRRRVLLGTVVPLTPDEIAALALITPEDVERAQREVIPELRELLDAVPVRKRNARPAQPSN